MSMPATAMNCFGAICQGCGACLSGGPHDCHGARGTTPFAPFQTIPPAPPITLYTIQKCPVCEGCGRVPRDFYGETKNNSKQIICQTCHGAGILKVHNFTGAVEPTV